MRRGLTLLALVVTHWLAVLLPATAGGGCHREPGPEVRGEQVELYQNCIGPSVLRTDVAKTVTFMNRDEIVHNIVGARWGTDELRGKATFTHTFNSPGTYPFSCTFHPGMVGAVVVGGGADAAAAQLLTEPPSATAQEPETNAAVRNTDRLPLGLAVGAVVGSIAALGGRRLLHIPASPRRLRRDG